MEARRDSRRWLMYLGVFTAIALFVFLVCKFKNIEEDVLAADLSQFRAGNIMSDAAMSDYSSMSEADIQNFLKSKNSCNNSDWGLYVEQSGLYPNVSWHWENGHFVCMADENFDGESAAHIIWQAAQDYHINPKVLIVLLEKEQGLVTDTFPHSIQYRSATGYGCPDTAACDTKYYGFKNQIRNAAAMFRTVLDGGWTNYPLGDNYIQYNPNAGCGGSVVNIENRATSVLYRYTPYQPNASALAAGYGTGDSCGAYGNRDFYNYYTDWFGSTQAVSYKAITVPDGVYEIQSALNNSKVLDVAGGDFVSGANVQLWDSNGTDAQKWNFTKLDDGNYKITNAVSGKTLDLNDANTDDGSNIKIWDYSGNCAQRWKLIESGSNVVIASACSLNSVIDVNGGSTANGANIQIYRSNGTNAQKWNLMPVEKAADGLYYIKSNINSGKVIDISGGTANANNGTNIHLWDLNETAAQYWRITRDADGYYTVINPNTGKALDVAGASTNSGANIQLYISNGTCAQKWRILKNGDQYTFISACSYKVIDVSGGSSQNDANIQLYEANNTNAQKWQFADARVFENMNEVTFTSALNKNKVLDVAGAGTWNGVNVQLYDSNGTDAQIWNIEYNEQDNTYKIISALNKNKVLDVVGAGTWNGVNVQLYDSNNTCAQKWNISQSGDYYTFASACSGKVLDVSGGGTKNGTNIQLYESNGTNAQKWKIER